MVFKGTWSDIFASDFQTFWDFGIRRKLIYISYFSLVHGASEKCTIWKISYENMTSYGNYRPNKLTTSSYDRVIFSCIQMVWPIKLKFETILG